MLKTIIIDDEPLALRQLRGYLSKLSEVELIASFRSAVEAEEYMLPECREVIDLIFCDINMPELSGVEFVRRMQEREVLPMVIFTTAHSEYAVEGFRLDAVDYLLKPFPFVDLERSVKRAISLYELRHIKETSEVSEVVSESEYLSVKADYKVTLVKFSDIVYMESEGEYVRMHIVGQRPITTLFRLKNMEAQLPATQFVRTHRSFIVNLNYVVSYERGRVYISKDDYLPIGQNYRESFHRAISERR